MSPRTALYARMERGFSVRNEGVCRKHEADFGKVCVFYTNPYRPPRGYRRIACRRRPLSCVFNAQDARGGRPAVQPAFAAYLVQQGLALPHEPLQPPHLRPRHRLRLPQGLREFEEGGLNVSIRMDKREHEQQALQVLARQRQQQSRRAQGGREGDLRARTERTARRLVQAQQVQHKRPVLSRRRHGKWAAVKRSGSCRQATGRERPKCQEYALLVPSCRGGAMRAGPVRAAPPARVTRQAAHVAFLLRNDGILSYCRACVQVVRQGIGRQAPYLPLPFPAQWIGKASGRCPGATVGSGHGGVRQA